MKQKILELLKNSDDYVSGQVLCDKFGVSRTAIWKAITALKNEGYDIDSVTSKGYCLKLVPDVLTSSEIGTRLNTEWLGRPMVCYESIGSTNTEIRNLAEKGAKEGTLAVADMQTAGRGRRGRDWLMTPGNMLAFSFLLRPNFSPDSASMITILAAVAILRAVEKNSDYPVQIKWPNDIIINKKKVCGILTEMSIEEGYILHVVVGIGINVNIESFPEEIKSTAGSIFSETGKKINRAQLLADCLKEFEALYEGFCKEIDLSSILDEYNSKLVSMNNQVRVLDPKGEFCGTCRGMDSLGQLLVERDDGNIEAVYAGEVSVRGVYGYV